eukprot:gene751-1435_t
MSVEEALAKARAIAAKLGLSTSTTPTGELGKRKSRWDEDQSAAFGAGLGAMTKKKVYIPVREHPDINFLGLLIGPRGKTQKELQERTGAKILVRGRGSQKEGMSSGHPDDDDELHVAIEGSNDAVSRALKEIEDILFNPEQALRLKQDQLKNLAEMNGNSSALTTTSQRDHYGNAMALDDNSVELRVPNNLVGLIIGKGGEHIQKLQSQTGAHVQIAKESDMKPGETCRSIILRGAPDAVAEAKRRIDDLITERTTPQQQTQNPLKNNNNKKELDNYAFVLRLPVANDKVGIIIGRGGVTIKSIQERTRAHVQVPTGPDEDNQEVRTLSIAADSREAVEAAQMEISMVLQQQQQQSNMPPPNSVFIQVPDDKVGVIIGRQGTTIKDIQQRTQTRIQIPPQADPGTNPPIRTCSIQGSPDQQFMAKFEIETLLGLMPGGTDPHGGGGGGYGMGMGMGMSQGYGGGGMGMGGMAGMGMYGGGQPNYGMGGGGGGMGMGMGMYGQSYSQPTTDSYYGYQQQQQQQDPMAATIDPNASASAAIPSDPTAYYNDYWQYAAYYGEAASRIYYGSWSPPEGTPAPEGFVIPVPVPDVPAPPAEDGTQSQSQSESQLAPVDSTLSSESTSVLLSSSDSSTSVEQDPVYAEWQQQQGQCQGQGQPDEGEIQTNGDGDGSDQGQFGNGGSGGGYS